MGKQNASRTGLFLIELILSIFFFIIAAAIVLQLFVNSHFISRNTISINNALLYSQNMSEIFLSDNGSFEDIKKVYNGNLTYIQGAPSDIIVMLFDINWEAVTDNADAKYIILTYFESDDTFSYLNIYVTNYSENIEYQIISGDYKSSLIDSDVIYQQEVKKYNGKQT